MCSYQLSSHGSDKMRSRACYLIPRPFSLNLVPCPFRWNKMDEMDKERLAGISNSERIFVYMKSWLNNFLHDVLVKAKFISIVTPLFVQSTSEKKKIPICKTLLLVWITLNVTLHEFEFLMECMVVILNIWNIRIQCIYLLCKLTDIFQIS